MGEKRTKDVIIISLSLVWLKILLIYSIMYTWRILSYYGSCIVHEPFTSANNDNNTHKTPSFQLRLMNRWPHIKIPLFVLFKVISFYYSEGKFLQSVSNSEKHTNCRLKDTKTTSLSVSFDICSHLSETLLKVTDSIGILDFLWNRKPSPWYVYRSVDNRRNVPIVCVVIHVIK